jgi:hypothetical protein
LKGLVAARVPDADGQPHIDPFAGATQENGR